MTWPPPLHPQVTKEIDRLRTIWADRGPLGFDVVYKNQYATEPGGKVAVIMVWGANQDGYEGRIDARVVTLEEA